jgi:hypothetical protein
MPRLKVRSPSKSRSRSRHVSPPSPCVISLIPLSPCGSSSSSRFLFSFFSFSFVRSLFSRAFLPSGCFDPSKVSPDYLSYQFYDSLQGLSSYLRGLLTTQALFQGLGVSSLSLTAASATVQWIIRDGTSMIGGILFGSLLGDSFGPEIKRWRLIADIANDIGLTLELISPLCPQYFLYFAALGSLFKAICGTAAGACRSALMEHFSRSQNAAELAVKENNQETAITLIGLLFGYFMTVGLSEQSNAIWIAFFLLTLIHIWANVRAMRVLSLTRINQQRAHILINQWLADGRILSPSEVSQREYIFHFPSSEEIIPIGYSKKANHLIEGNFQHFQRNQKYFIEWNKQTEQIQVLLGEHYSSRDLLEALIIGLTIKAARKQGARNEMIVKDASNLIKPKCDSFVQAAESAGWKLDLIHYPIGSMRYEFIRSQQKTNLKIQNTL